MSGREVGKKIKSLRLQYGISQVELAEIAHLSLRTIQRIENGETEARGDSLKRLSKALHISIEDLTLPVMVNSIKPELKADKNILLLLNGSALGFLLFPLLGIICPWILWTVYKDKITGVREQGKQITPVAQMRALIAFARDAGLRVHVDGARLWNAAVALGVTPVDLVAGADSVMVTLSKGLCCPAGSLLAASRDRIDAARRVRQQLGGGMRQAGILAAAGIVALETMVARLGEDHANARLLASALEGREGVATVPAETNIVVARLTGRTAPDLVGALKARGVLASAMDNETVRFVTHHDASRAACERAAGEIAAVLG